jgi:hypothetical protein
MPERDASDEEVADLSRAYLARIHDQPVPAGLEDRAMVFAFSRGRAKLSVRILGAAAIVLISALTAAGVLAFHHDGSTSGGPASGSASESQLHIVRIPGKLVLPSLDRTISGSPTIARLATEIRGLPLFPRYERCAASFGLSYALTFTSAGSSPWTATIQAEGCEGVQVAGQPVHWAAHSPQIWTDLATVLGLRADQLQPSVCIGPTTPNCVPLVTDPSPPVAVSRSDDQRSDKEEITAPRNASLALQ